MKNIALALIVSAAALSAAACREDEPVAVQQESEVITTTIAGPVQDVADVEQDLTLPVGSHDWTTRIVVGQQRNAAGEVVSSPALDPSRPILVDMTLTEAPAGVVARLELRRDEELLADTQVPVNQTTRRAQLEMVIPQTLRGSGRAELVILVGAAEQQRIPIDL